MAMFTIIQIKANRTSCNVGETPAEGEGGITSSSVDIWSQLDIAAMINIQPYRFAFLPDFHTTVSIEAAASDNGAASPPFMGLLL
jgi:hypothetical protein